MVDRSAVARACFAPRSDYLSPGQVHFRQRGHHYKAGSSMCAWLACAFAVRRVQTACVFTTAAYA